MKKREQNIITQKLLTAMEKEGLDALVLTRTDAIYYATGYYSAFSKMGMDSTVVVLTQKGEITVIVNQFEKQAAEQFLDSSIKIETYPTWIYIEDFDNPNEVKEEHPDPDKAIKMAAEIVLSSASNPKVGIQERCFSHNSWDVITSIFHEENLIDCERMLENVRKYKTPWEIDVLRIAAVLCERAMKETAKATLPGMTEAELMNMYRRISFSLSNDVNEVGQAHTLGECYSPTVLPRNKVINPGDVIRLDVGPEYMGYVSDLARTYAVGKASARKEQIYDALYKGHCKAMEMIGPGVKLSEVFEQTQKCIRANGLPTYIRGHFGHSVGTGDCEQYPYIGPSATDIFEPGMVFCVETPYYGSDSNSFNLEDTILITENGYERFTIIPDNLYWV